MFVSPSTYKIVCSLPNLSPPFAPISKVQPSQTIKPPTRFSILLSSLQHSNIIKQDNIEDHVIGDCVVFEEGIFEDPYLQEELNLQTFEDKKSIQSKSTKKVVNVEPENLVPEKWKEVQAEISITKKERRKIAQEIQFNSRVEKRKQGLVPLRHLNLEEYMAYKEAKLAQEKLFMLDNPTRFPVKDKVEGENDGGSNEGSLNERVAPKDPRWQVYGRGLDDVTEFFNRENYDPSAMKTPEARQRLFTKEERDLLNKRKPDLAPATSEKWLPLHTLVTSGEFYLVDSLLKHEVDINGADKDGLTALHKAIIGKKQAITNYLLRNSANPFVRDKDGATLMHYAVQTASSQAIKVLLLYNVSINLPDNDGWTPLHLAVQARRTDLVKLLLIKGADATLKNKDGLTPLQLCLYSGQDIRTYELIKLLKNPPKPRPWTAVYQGRHYSKSSMNEHTNTEHEKT